jgi:hypothetical protein
VSLLDLDDSGRLMAYRECSVFQRGGKVDLTREIASYSFASQTYSTVVGLTVCSMIFIVLRQLSIVKHEMLRHGTPISLSRFT